MDEGPLAGLAPLGFALATGLLLALASPGSGLAVLAWVAWVPLFRAVGEVTALRAAWLAFVAGGVFTAATLSWVAFPIAAPGSAGLPAAIAIATVAGIAYALPFAAYGAALAFDRARRGRFGIALAALLWPALEWTRTLGPAAAPWNLLGYSQPSWSAVAQIAEATGVFGVSATIVAVNALVHVATVETRRESRRRLAVGSTIVVLALLAGRALGSVSSLPSTGASLRVGLVQAAGGGDADPLATAIALSRGVVAEGAKVVIWPEGAARIVVGDGPLDETDAPADAREAFARVAGLARELGTPIVVGVEGVVREERGRGSVSTSRNRVLLVDPTGRIADAYDKRILVPLGETLPAVALEAGHRALVAGERPIRAGDSPARFAIGSARAAILVCWEAIFPGFVASAASGTDLLIEITDDDSLGSPLAAEQHLAMAAFRAVENRRPLVRAARSGISAVVGADGVFRARSGLGDVTSLVVDVPLDGRATVYGRCGDLFAIAAGLAAVALLVYAGRSRRTRAVRLGTPD